MIRMNQKWPFPYSGNTALYLAVLQQDLETVLTLVTRGVDLDATDSNMQTALFAHNSKRPDTNDAYEILKILLNNGASLYISRSDGKTPMEYLLKYGNRKTWLTVLRSNANLCKKCGPKGDTALHFLLQNRRLCYDPKEEIRLLLSKGFNVDVRNNRGVSPLSLAIEQGFGKSAEYLMKNGAVANWLEIIARTSILEMFSRHEYEQSRKRQYYQNIVEMILKQQGTPIQHLSKELNEKFSVFHVNRFYMEIIIAHLVIEEVRESIPCSILESVTSKYYYKGHYELYKDRIKELKDITVYDTVNLYQLMTESDEKIINYISDKEFILAMKYFFSQRYQENLYYLYIIRKRIENAMRTREISKLSGHVLCELTGLDAYGVSGQHYIVYKILGYLSKRDIVNLFEGRSVPCDDLLSLPNYENVPKNFVSKVKRFFLRR